MTVRVKHTWPYGEYHKWEPHGDAMYIKFKDMIVNGKGIVRTADSIGLATYEFVDQASADEWVAFMAQFNPESVEVTTI